jgi:hypothetical protein
VLLLDLDDVVITTPIKKKKESISFEQDGVALNNRNILFYSDGNRIWINTPEGFRPLIRTGDRYEYIGLMPGYSAKGTRLGEYDPELPVISNLPRTGSYIFLQKVHYLDIETGEIY